MFTNVNINNKIMNIIIIMLILVKQKTNIYIYIYIYKESLYNGHYDLWKNACVKCALTAFFKLTET